MGVLFMGCLTTATMPVLQSRLLGDSAVVATLDGRRLEATELVEAAAERDRLAPDAAARAGGFAFDEWQVTPHGGEGAFRRAVDWQREAIRRDPFSAAHWWTLAEYEQARFRAKGEAQAAAAGLEALGRAVERYPANARLRANRALFMAEARRTAEAAVEAAVALRLDDVNRAEGHTDRFLARETRRTLEALDAADDAPRS